MRQFLMIVTCSEAKSFLIIPWSCVASYKVIRISKSNFLKGDSVGGKKHVANKKQKTTTLQQKARETILGGGKGE